MSQNPDTSRAALERLMRQNTTTDVPTAAPFLGMGSNAGYQAVEEGKWPTRVLRIGRKIRIPTADLGRCLGVDLGAPSPADGHDETELVVPGTAEAVV